MRALLGTHHLNYWSGSEVVVIEVAEALAECGFETDFYSPFASAGFVERALPRDTRVFTAPEEVDLLDYDLVYVQHQVLSRVLNHQEDDAIFGRHRPFFVFNHLSTVEPFEIPGPFVEVDVADAIWTQSPKTLDIYRQRYHARFSQAVCVPNPAPASFQVPAAPSRPEELRTILSVSNHPPGELIEAFDILRNHGIRISRIGGRGNNRRTSPSDVLESDCLVTIGKSTQYGLRARKPVYCYDHFGGPGWLSEENFQQTSYRNFSGLNDSTRRSAGDIARDIRDGYAGAAAFAASREARSVETYALEHYVERLVRQTREHKQHPRPLYVERDGPCDRAAARARWSHEAQIYALIDREYGFRSARGI